MTDGNLLTALSSIAIKGSLLFVIGWAATRILRRATASVRHVVWLTVIVGTLLIPFVASVTPMNIAVLPPVHDIAPLASADLANTVYGTAPTIARSTSHSPAGTSRFNTPNAASMAIGLWAAVALILLVRVARSLISVQRILHSSRVASADEWRHSLDAAALELGLATPELLVSDDVEIAFTCSPLSPTIVIPASASEWSADRRRVVLLHELAHIRRRDLVSHAIAHIACAVYWFNPLVWIAARRLRVESELASDDVVLAAGIRPSAYAQHLLDMVTSFGKGAPRLALAIAEPREFEGRLVAILDRTNLWAITRNQRRAMVGGVGMLSLSIGAIAPVPERTASVEALPSAQSTIAYSKLAPVITSPRMNSAKRSAPGGTQLSLSAQHSLRRLGVGALVNPVMSVLRQEGRLALTGAQADSLAMLNRLYMQQLTVLWRPVLTRIAKGEPTRLGAIPQQSVDVMRSTAPLVRALLTHDQLEKVDALTAERLNDRALRELRRRVAVTPGDLIAANGPGARIGGGGVPISRSANGGRAGR